MTDTEYPASLLVSEEVLRTRVADLESSFDVLTKIVSTEYPADKSLPEIAAIWGDGVRPEQIEALRRVCDRYCPNSCSASTSIFR